MPVGKRCWEADFGRKSGEKGEGGNVEVAEEIIIKLSMDSLHGRPGRSGEAAILKILRSRLVDGIHEEKKGVVVLIQPFRWSSTEVSCWL